MDLLDKLAALKLKQPKGLRRFVFDETNYQYASRNYKYDCVEVMEKWQGVWILRVFAFNLRVENRTFNNIELMEVQRKVFGIKDSLSSYNVEARPMSGRYIYWESNSNTFVRVKKNWEFHGYEMYDHQEIINDLNIPYCSWDIVRETSLYKNCHIRFIDYISLYVSEPRIERLVKLGLSEYLPSLRYLDLSKRKIYDVFKIDRKWESKIGELSMSDLMTLRRADIESIEDLKLYNEWFKNGYYNYKNIKKFADFNKAINYLKSLKLDKSKARDYDDYLGFAYKIGAPMKDSRVLYPVNFTEAHDEAMKKVDILDNEHLSDDFLKQYTNKKKHRYSDGGLTIKPVKFPEDLINESRVLNHCVRSYAEDVAKGKTEILFVRKESEIDVPFVTVEVIRNKIMQVRGKNNSTANEEVKAFLLEWSKEKGIQYEI